MSKSNKKHVDNYYYRIQKEVDKKCRDGSIFDEFYADGSCEMTFLFHRPIEESLNENNAASVEKLCVDFVEAVKKELWGS